MVADYFKLYEKCTPLESMAYKRKSKRHFYPASKQSKDIENRILLV